MEPYSGSPGTITTPLSVAISGTSNATPIVVTTVSNHGFGTGNSVHIAGVLGNLASNGDWTITVITANSFSLTGSTGSGAYTSGGIATDYSLTPQISLFVDGTDGIMASNLNAAPIALADRSQYLALQLPRTVASVSDLRSSSPPAGNIFILLPPSASGNSQVITNSNFASPVSAYVAPFGGVYYFDPAYSALDNGSTCIKPNTITGAGRWRMAGGPLFTVVDEEYDINSGNPTGSPSLNEYQSIAGSSGPPQAFTRTSPAPNTYAFLLTAGTPTSIGPGKMYVGDVIDVSCTVSVVAAAGTLSSVDWFWSPAGGSPLEIGNNPIVDSSAAGTYLAFARARYVVLASDITAGAATLSPLLTYASGSGTVTATLLDVQFTVRRP
jgi:Ubiquitin-activating enzyme E1 FCCH domain